MKRIMTILTAVAAITACTSPEAKYEKTVKGIISNYTAGYDSNADVNNIIFVLGKGGSDADVRLLTRDGKGGWSETLACDGHIGRNGLDKEREGDGKTPVGDFGIITAFGIKPDPGTALPYIDVTPDLWCCGDSIAYNRIIDINEYPHECAGEHLCEYEPAYNYAFFPDYNAGCTFGLGSAIFFHCNGSKPYTAGCVAVDEEDMVAILKALDLHSRVIIDSIPGVTALRRR